jgi:uncharacterized protein YcfJ
MEGGDSSQKPEGKQLPDSDRKLNRFVLGAIVGGLAVYFYTGGNLTATIVGAVIVGLLVSLLWK